MIEKIIKFTTVSLQQFLVTMPLHLDGYQFIKTHQPWKGMNKYGWSARILVVAAVLLGLFLFKDVFLFAKDVVVHPEVVGAGISSFLSDFSFEKMDWALDGSKKYLILIILEIFTFHFIQRTLEIQMGRKPENTIKDFIEAEKRMIKAAFLAYVMEIVTRSIASFLIGIVGLDFLLETPAEYLIQFYFLGFTIVDNYHECFGLSLKESRKRTKDVAGVAIAVGAVSYFLMFIPLVGVVAATMLGAVTATLAMQRFAPMESPAVEEELV